jgi:hypothetical protein
MESVALVELWVLGINTLPEFNLQDRLTLL